MKKIINGIVYDTKRSKCVGSWDNGRYMNDLLYFSEDLYQKENGEFFLFGQGNAMSKYASVSGKCDGSGKVIIPLTYILAQEWAEKHLFGSDYRAVFGSPQEDAEDVLLNLRVSARSAAKLERLSSERGMTQSAFLDLMITEYIVDSEDE